MGRLPRRSSLRDDGEWMSVAELQELEEVKLLMAKGQQTGVLTYAEVATALAEDEPALSHRPEDERAVDGKGRRRKAKATIDLKPDMTTDSLQLFLKDIGKVRLLTAQE